MKSFPSYHASTLLVRIVVGLIFLSEGIQKFLTPEATGAGRLAKIGFSYPTFWANFTGTFEIICGLLILIGLLPAWLPYHYLSL